MSKSKVVAAKFGNGICPKDENYRLPRHNVPENPYLYRETETTQL